MNYQEYLGLDTLLSLQCPRVPPGDDRVHAAEHFFIVVHQSTELWLAQILLDLNAATDALAAVRGDAELALEHLGRVSSALGVMLAHLDALDRLPSQCFARFRPFLGTASGVESTQFRLLDRALGVRAAVRAPILSAFATAAAAGGMDLLDVFRADHAAGALRRVADTLLDIAQRYWRWKVAHLSVVMRMLGELRGTAGTSGVEYLMRRNELPFAEIRDAERAARFEIPVRPSAAHGV